MALPTFQFRTENQPGINPKSAINTISKIQTAPATTTAPIRTMTAVGDAPRQESSITPTMDFKPSETTTSIRTMSTAGESKDAYGNIIPAGQEAPATGGDNVKPPVLPGIEPKESVASTDFINQFLADPTKMPTFRDALGKTQYDLAREQTAADTQAQKEQYLEGLRGQLAAQGITGPAAEQMIAQAGIDFVKLRAAREQDVTAQELSARQEYANKAMIEGLGVAGDIELQNLKNTGAMDLQNAEFSWKSTVENKMQAGFNLGAQDSQNNVTRTDQELRDMGYDESQIWSYKAGLSGQSVEDFNNAKQNYSDALVASIVSGDITDDQLLQIRTGYEGLYGVDLTGITPDLNPNNQTPQEQSDNLFTLDPQTRATSINGYLSGDLNTRASIGVNNTDINDSLVSVMSENPASFYQNPVTADNGLSVYYPDIVLNQDKTVDTKALADQVGKIFTSTKPDGSTGIYSIGRLKFDYGVHPAGDENATTVTVYLEEFDKDGNSIGGIIMPWNADLDSTKAMYPPESGSNSSSIWAVPYGEYQA